jgi:pimeloyl-ACP methyl ester carboxylesterase
MNYDNRSVRMRGIEIGYRVEGNGGRNIVLLHGLNSHSGTWRKTFPSLVGEFTVLAPSLPHHKGRAGPELADTYAEMVASVCEEAGARQASIIGNSMGGWVAMRMIARGEIRADRLVLEDSAGADSDDPDSVGRAGVRALIVWGESDGVLPLALGKDLSSRLPSSELRVVPGAGHVPHWEAPDLFNGLVGTFLRGV